MLEYELPDLECKCIRCNRVLELLPHTKSDMRTDPTNQIIDGVEFRASGMKGSKLCRGWGTYIPLVINLCDGCIKELALQQLVGRQPGTIYRDYGPAKVWSPD